MDRRGPSAPAVLLASWAIPLLAGAAVGLGDGALAWIQGRVAQPGGWLLLHSASLGALLAWAALLPLTILLGLMQRFIRPASRLGASLALVLVSPLAILLGRALYKRIPWSAGDVALGLTAVLGLLLAVVILAAGFARAAARGERKLCVRLAQLAIPGLLLAIPAGVRLAGAAGSPEVERPGSAAGPSLLLITVDTLRSDRLGCYGCPSARTPWIDRLARRGTTYTDCVAPSPWTLPSLGSLLTGTHPGEHLVLEELSGLSGSVTSIAEVAQRAGYRTAAFVSNPWLATGSLARGFDTFDVAERLESQEPVRGTRLYGVLAKTALRLLRLDRADRISARALAWLDSGDGSWLLWAHYFDPHLPNWPPRPWDRLDGPPPSHVGSSMTVEQIRAGEFPGGDAGRREIERLYDGEVSLTDASIGNVLRWIDGSGSGPTAIVFSADHGEELWDHDDYGHGHAMFDEVVRVPLVVVSPGGTSGRVVPSLGRLIDLAPTALAALGLEPGEEFTGVDLAARPGGVEESYGEAILYGHEQKFLRAGRFKLVFDPLGPGETPLRLFDLQDDPGERHNLAAVDPARTDSLFTVLQEWIERVGSMGAMAARDLPPDVDPTVLEQLRALGYVD